MKPLTLLAFLAALLIVSCTDTSIEPINSGDSSVHLIKLPPKAGLYAESDFFTISDTIDGEEGGTLKIKESYVALDGHTVKIDVKLKIKKNSFQGVVPITMTVDDHYAAVWFTPHMIFDKPTELNVKFEGINLKELELLSGSYDFIYINGQYVESVDYNQIQVQEDQGKISVKKAKLNHFSRYAFAR